MACAHPSGRYRRSPCARPSHWQALAPHVRLHVRMRSRPHRAPKARRQLSTALVVSHLASSSRCSPGTARPAPASAPASCAVPRPTSCVRPAAACKRVRDENRARKACERKLTNDLHLRMMYEYGRLAREQAGDARTERMRARGRKARRSRLSTTGRQVYAGAARSLPSANKHQAITDAGDASTVLKTQVSREKRKACEGSNESTHRDCS